MSDAAPTTGDRKPDDETPRCPEGGSDKPANTAPDAVKDPNEKTDGKPGLPPGSDQGDDADPGGG